MQYFISISVKWDYFTMQQNKNEVCILVYLYSNFPTLKNVAYI
jgi:hypothetical protein